jgi:hypothetical protein
LMAFYGSPFLRRSTGLALSVERRYFRQAVVAEIAYRPTGKSRGV